MHPEAWQARLNALLARVTREELDVLSVCESVGEILAEMHRQCPLRAPSTAYETGSCPPEGCDGCPTRCTAGQSWR